MTLSQRGEISGMLYELQSRLAVGGVLARTAELTELSGTLETMAKEINGIIKELHGDEKQGG